MTNHCLNDIYEVQMERLVQGWIMVEWLMDQEPEKKMNQLIFDYTKNKVSIHLLDEDNSFRIFHMYLSKVDCLI